MSFVLRGYRTTCGGINFWCLCQQLFPPMIWTRDLQNRNEILCIRGPINIENEIIDGIYCWWYVCDGFRFFCDISSHFIFVSFGTCHAKICIFDTKPLPPCQVLSKWMIEKICIMSQFPVPLKVISYMDELSIFLLFKDKYIRRVF